MTQTALERMGPPLYYIAGNAAAAGFLPPPNRYGQSLRTWVRSLGGMQKEALVVSAATGTAWRFACDEGTAVGGDNCAPNPLTYLSAGMIASYMAEFIALADRRSITVRDLELVLENFYYRAGDFRQGTMVSGALPPELDVYCRAEGVRDDSRDLTGLVYDAVAASPLNGLARGHHPSLFALVHNGRDLTPTQVTPLGRDPLPDPGDGFAELRPMTNSPAVPSLIEMTLSEEAARRRFENAPPRGPDIGADKSLLHMHSTCTLRPDGIKEIHKEQYSPVAPSWRYLSDEAERFGGQGRAPDAAYLISAGIALCFMTQMGRFARMAKLPLTGYRIVQDTHFSLGGASGGTDEAGTAAPVETHVYLDTEADDDTAQRILGVGERTCFLHAFCRDDVKPKARIRRRPRAA